ncbi:tyrosine-type recombinase/integrase [Roseiconus nitratireducens]|uniref:Tyrosine-type recombinase/integrase n=1 Tax=Roseiconus nitratireducens TaxID=2605748 RepID=A0A5M6CYJ5_9BACT|nr:site-specific integrase [Roseiconus nitratireducens]KAA5540281.1 tyrosine-type recombinase/integrase [Roseiconus nitratireducens]
MAQSTSRRKKRKVPLSIHKASGLWCKVRKGKRHYFEKVADDPEGTESLAQWYELLAGKEPKRNGITTIKDVAEAWMQDKRDLLDAKEPELVQDTFDFYKKSCELVFESLGKDTDAESLTPKDFAQLRRDLAKRYGPTALKNRIGNVRSMFNFAVDEGLLKKPAHFGKRFKPPAAKVMRRVRLKKGDQDFTAGEIHTFLDKVEPKWRAMILLGVQAGFGNEDVAFLKSEFIDLESGWLNWPREKTATKRRVPLWAETIQAIRDTIESHPGGSDYLFVGNRGRDYIDYNRTGNNRISGAFKPVLKSVGLPETGRGFYCFRRTFETQAEACGDIIAVKHVMGHIPGENDMSARYRQRVVDKRLRRVVETVHGWLYGEEVDQ